MKTKEKVKIQFNGKYWQCFRKDRKGWFKSGFGFSLDSVVSHWVGKGYKIEILKEELQ